MIISATPTNPDRAAKALWGIDRTELRQANRLFAEIAQNALPGEASNRLKFILGQIANLDRLVTGRRITVPDEILHEMMRTGLDQWIGDLLGYTRDEIRGKRKARGITHDVPRTWAGGYLTRQAEWEAQWRTKLKELGLWTEAKAS